MEQPVVADAAPPVRPCVAWGQTVHRSRPRPVLLSGIPQGWSKRGRRAQAGAPSQAHSPLLARMHWRTCQSCVPVLVMFSLSSEPGSCPSCVQRTAIWTMATSRACFRAPPTCCARCYPGRPPSCRLQIICAACFLYQSSQNDNLHSIPSTLPQSERATLLLRVLAGGARAAAASGAAHCSPQRLQAHGPPANLGPAALRRPVE
jgi:hypothetical protein